MLLSAASLQRFGSALVPWGQVDLKSKASADNFGPIDPDCHCSTCTTHHRAYLHALIAQKESVACNLITVHNVAYQVTGVGGCMYAYKCGWGMCGCRGFWAVSMCACVSASSYKFVSAHMSVSVWVGKVLGLCMHMCVLPASSAVELLGHVTVTCFLYTTVGPNASPTSEYPSGEIPFLCTRLHEHNVPLGGIPQMGGGCLIQCGDSLAVSR